MAKRKLFWHVGPISVTTAFLAEALERWGGSLPEVHTVPLAAAVDADLDLRRAHAALGRTRASVDGAWKRVEDQVWKHKGRWLLSTPAMGRAPVDQIRLARDGLRGVELHVVVLRTDPAADVDAVLSAWAQPLHPERVHLVDCDPDAASVWSAFLGIAGLQAPLPVGLDVVEPGTPESAMLRHVESLLDPARPDLVHIAAELVAQQGSGARLDTTARTLAGAVSEVARLRAESERLRAQVADLDRRRRKHKRRLQALRASTPEHPDLTPVA